MVYQEINYYHIYLYKGLRFKFSKVFTKSDRFFFTKETVSVLSEKHGLAIFGEGRRDVCCQSRSIYGTQISQSTITQEAYI